jgi:hypothetical protein
MLRSMNRANVIAGLVWLAVGAIFWWLAAGVPDITATDSLGGRFFPRLVAGAMMVASVGLLVTGLMGIEISGGTSRGKGEQAPPSPEQEVTEEGGPAYLGGRVGPGELRLLGFIAVMTVYTLVLPLLGYIVASVIAFAALIWIAGERRPLGVVLGALGIAALLYILFAVVFGMNVPTASLF